MKVYTISDIHLDYKENQLWLHGLSLDNFQEDILILGGDISAKTGLVVEAFEAVRKRFREVIYTPGNHDLWVHRNGNRDSFDHFYMIKKIAEDYGIHTTPAHFGALSIIPLLGWYDYSFGPPSKEILRSWSDYSLCKWPEGFQETEVTSYFISINEKMLAQEVLETQDRFVISFSHFLPRIDLMPVYIPEDRQKLYPVLGSDQIEKQIRRLNPDIHIYGHSHFNRNVILDNITYINNALGYPHETRITTRKLICVYETQSSGSTD